MRNVVINVIRKATQSDLKAIDKLAILVIDAMHHENIHQWNHTYPRSEHFLKDIEQNALYVYVEGDAILGVMAIYEENETAYEVIQWIKTRAIVIHRVLIKPDLQGKGIGSKMLLFAKKYAKNHGYESIKIDTYPANHKMRALLKNHQFHEMGYIKSINRIAYELVVKSPLNRIIILGPSGSGKTTLSKNLSSQLNMPYLHLDSVYWLKDWQSLDKLTFAKKVRGYIMTHPRFVMDGNYTNSVTFMERLKIADTIILLDYDRQLAINGIYKRAEKYKHTYRSDMAEGCIEGVDQEFLHYVYDFKDKMHRMITCAMQFKYEKQVLWFTSRKQLNRWFDELKE
jgi:adenylate kinase family enzyme/ribosomal protein S18 acetylase RimI-like enzyme